MCIPCVMCGACFDVCARGGTGDHCPECGNPLPPDAVACPSCYTFVGLNRNSKLQADFDDSLVTDEEIAVPALG